MYICRLRRYWTLFIYITRYVTFVVDLRMLEGLRSFVMVQGVGLSCDRDVSEALSMTDNIIKVDYDVIIFVHNAMSSHQRR